MGRMHLDHFETGDQRALGRIDEGLNDVGDFAVIKLPGLSVLGVERDR